MFVYNRAEMFFKIYERPQGIEQTLWFFSSKLPSCLDKSWCSDMSKDFNWRGIPMFPVYESFLLTAFADCSLFSLYWIRCLFLVPCLLNSLAVPKKCPFAETEVRISDKCSVKRRYGSPINFSLFRNRTRETSLAGRNLSSISVCETLVKLHPGICCWKKQLYQ